MNKKGIELSVNFLVTFILAFVVFGFGIYFASTISDEAFSQADVTEEFLNQRIQQIACSSSDKICISNNYAELRRGDTEAVGVFINNFESSPDKRVFQMEQFGSGKRYEDDGSIGESVSGSDSPLLLMPGSTDVANPVTSKSIDARSVGNMGFAVFVPKTAESGKYVYTIEISDITSSGVLGASDPLDTIRKKVTFYVE
jgi:hypothetical protein